MTILTKLAEKAKIVKIKTGSVSFLNCEIDIETDELFNVSVKSQVSFTAGKLIPHVTLVITYKNIIIESQSVFDNDTDILNALLVLEKIHYAKNQLEAQRIINKLNK